MVTRTRTRIRDIHPLGGFHTTSYTSHVGLTTDRAPSNEQFILFGRKGDLRAQVVDWLSEKYCANNSINWVTHYYNHEELQSKVKNGDIFSESFTNLFVMADETIAEKDVLNKFVSSVNSQNKNHKKVVFLIEPDLSQKLGFDGMWQFQSEKVTYHPLSKDLLAIDMINYGAIFISHLIYPDASTRIDHLIVSKYVLSALKKEISEAVAQFPASDGNNEYLDILESDALTFTGLAEIIRTIKKESAIKLLQCLADYICSQDTLKNITKSIAPADIV